MRQQLTKATTRYTTRSPPDRRAFLLPRTSINLVRPIARACVLRPVHVGIAGIAMDFNAAAEMPHGRLERFIVRCEAAYHADMPAHLPSS